MKKSIFILFFLTLLIPFYLLHANNVWAQAGQVWETIVGDAGIVPPDQSDGGDGGDAGDGGGTDESPPPGIYMPPFSCNILYEGSTYPGSSHVWEIDFNRKGCGQDLGDPIFAVAPGMAIGVLPSQGRVIIRHDNGVYSLYGHMINIKVNNNDKIKFRQQIGQIGSTGTTGGPHLHFGQYLQPFPNMIPIKFDGKKHPASLPGDTLIDATRCIQVGPVNCKVLY